MSDNIKNPSIQPYERHVIFCTGPRCAPDSSESVYQTLKSKMRELKIDQKSVRRAQVHCFGICKGGPLMVVYPEGIWYHDLDNAKVLKIIDAHLIGGKPVTEWTFHHHE